MKRVIVAVVLLLSPLFVFAAEEEVELAHIKTDLTNKESLQNGAKLFMNYCIGCHSLKYARYNRIAKDLDIPDDLFAENLIFTGAKTGELMESSIPPKSAKAWFGATPPDLTLEARFRSADWIYSYLKGFYADESRPWGVNNTVFKDVAMPHVLVGLQGLCATAPEISGETKFDPLTGNVMSAESCESYAIQGSLSSEEYDAAVYDITNFLQYMGEPAQMDRKRIGIMVFAFLIVLYAVSFLYTRELHKDIH
ncbi:cytochrome c1 [Gynuella sunshinyii]|uniref:Cytochrome c1 n=1 Tax=Gynuella sunshinyii YC6258 TaxID=1445510 RepID=A0A0C5V381_9GAMM|nr:cytochrome c1 [Gynuella sunshinyii]AJQ93995.1 cytochrome c1 [Gynuella sunshinyii YC6258]